MDIPDCKRFTGYKPCEPFKVCDNCKDADPVGAKIAIVNLGAMGAVLMTTTILPALKRKYPVSTIYWVTDERHLPLLENNPYIDLVLPFTMRTVLTMQAMEFDLVCNVDKIPDACGFVQSLNAKEKLGFGLDKNGAVIPLNPGAEYNYRLGLNDELKFKKNNRTQPDMLREIFNLDKDVDPYVVVLNPEEEGVAEDYKNQFNLVSPVTGINTGSSLLFPNKRFPEETIVNMVNTLYQMQKGQKILLLGGKEDVIRNKKLADRLSEMVINTPADEGLRRGLAYVNICNIVITGDSLGMHMAVGLGKHIVAWFNVTCHQEIEIYNKGTKIISDAFCSPCWKQVCDLDLRCLNEPIADRICAAVKSIIYHWHAEKEINR